MPFLDDQFLGRSLISEIFSNRDPNIAISELLKPWQKPPRYDEIPEPLKKYWNRFIVSVRTKNAKYIHSSNGDSEYYDILNDPSEEKNIIQTLSEPQLKYFTDMAKPYFDELTKQYQKNKNRIISPQDNLDLDPEVVNALKALGYVR